MIQYRLLKDFKIDAFRSADSERFVKLANQKEYKVPVSVLSTLSKLPFIMIIDFRERGK